MTRPPECVVCAALPALPGDPLTAPEDVEYRPVRARAISPRSGPRKPRCETHQRAHERAKRARQQETRVARVYGLTAEQYDALYEFQGGRCAVCQMATGRTRRLSVDHDHELAKLHDHPVDQGCPECVRALTCSVCNRIVLGRYDTAALGRAIDVLTDPPYQRMRRGQS